MGPRDTHVAQIWSLYQVKYHKQRKKSTYTLTSKKESKKGRQDIKNFCLQFSIFSLNLSFGSKNVDRAETSTQIQFYTFLQRFEIG